MTDRPRHKTLVVTGVDHEQGIITYASDRECPPGVAYDARDISTWEFGPGIITVYSIPTLWQRIRGAWVGMLDGWRYGP